MKLPIFYYGHPVLRKRCEPVTEITDEIRKLVQDMIDTMDANDGIGLSAPQVGKSIRLFVLRNYINGPDGRWKVSEPIVFINPKLSSPSEETQTDTEGCLSIPAIREYVERPLKVTVEAMDLDGKIFTEELEGINARVRMHENDHLNGVLFVDRIDVNRRKKIDHYLRDIKKKHNP